MITSSRSESGFIIPLAVVITIVVTIVIAVVHANIVAQQKASGQGARKTATYQVSDGAVEAIQQALFSKREVQRDSFAITPDDIKTAALLTGATELEDAQSAYPASTPSGWGITLQNEASEGDLAGTWQVLRLLSPTGENPYITLYIRSWLQNGTDPSTATDPAIYKARLRPGSLADFQLITNTAIKLDPGVTISGRIHSNGFLNEELLPDASNPAARIWAESGSSITCNTAAGITPLVSSARGKVILPASARDCEVRENSGDLINLDGARESALRVMELCDPDYANEVTCIKSTASETQPVTLELQNKNVRVVSGTPYPFNIDVPEGGSRTILVDRSVRIKGSVEGRLTVIAWSAGGSGRAAPSIEVIGDLGRTAPTNTLNSSLGLIAENDIIVGGRDSDGTVMCPANITASMIAVSGTIGLPRALRAATLPVSSSFNCPRIKLVGSFASHGGVILNWSWGDRRDSIGYAERSFAWDPWLATYPAPFWPLGNAWELLELGPADADCITDLREEFMKPACR